MTFVQRRNRLTTHFSERIPVVKRRISVHYLCLTVIKSFTRTNFVLVGCLLYVRIQAFVGHSCVTLVRGDLPNKERRISISGLWIGA